MSIALFAVNIQEQDATQVDVHFIDDRFDILKPLQAMVKHRLDILPKQVTVAFHELHTACCDEDAAARQIGKAVCGTADNLADINIDYEDLIRKIADLALNKDQVDTKKWVHKNQGTMFCQIYNEALKQMNQMNQIIIDSDDPCLWRPEE